MTFLFLLINLVFIGAGMYFIHHEYNRSKYGYHTQGKIIKIEGKWEYSNGSASYMYYPVVQFHSEDHQVCLTKCLDKTENQTTAGMCNCTYAALREWDTKLNTTYKSLLAKLDPAAKTSLITAQRQWVLFKEKEIALIGATYGKAQGTMWQPIRASEVMELTKQRALQLEYLLEMLEEF